jgi:uncharacterized protein (TIGR00369 family)
VHLSRSTACETGVERSPETRTSRQNAFLILRVAGGIATGRIPFNPTHDPASSRCRIKEFLVENLQAFAQHVFESQPFSRFIGARLLNCGPGTAEISLPIVDHVKQQHGFVHGGAISYLADNSITFAGGLALGGNALTSEFKINYLKPAVGSLLVARAKAKGIGKRQAVCQCEIYAVNNGEEKLCAIAQGTVVPASAE